jgi:hypothetical protein
MSPTEFKMQHTIGWEIKTGHLPRPYSALPSQYIVGCIFYFVGLIITHEISCIYGNSNSSCLISVAPIGQISWF